MNSMTRSPLIAVSAPSEDGALRTAFGRDAMAARAWPDRRARIAFSTSASRFKPAIADHLLCAGTTNDLPLEANGIL